MNPHNRAVDHLHLAAMRLGDRVHQSVPNPSLTPAIEAVVSSRVRSIALRQIAPRGSRSQHPENAVHHPPVVLAFGTRTPLRQHSFDNAPLEIGKIVAHDPSSAVCDLESLFADLRYQ